MLILFLALKTIQFECHQCHILPLCLAEKLLWEVLKTKSDKISYFILTQFAQL